MGQYYVIANKTKREFIDPHFFGNGVKLMEFGVDGRSTMTGLAVLLASSNGLGGGDLHLSAGTKFDHIPGRWAGDSIVIAGDYDDVPTSPGFQVYNLCGDVDPLQEIAEAGADEQTHFKDISAEVLGCLLEDQWFRQDFITVESTNEAWVEYTKRQRREAWVKARPDDAVPESLS